MKRKKQIIKTLELLAVELNGEAKECGTCYTTRRGIKLK